jgi:hypothetical protein
MAETPLLLAFICLVYERLKKGTRVELYENVVSWFIQRKLASYPDLLSDLKSSENVYLVSKQQINTTVTEILTETWYDLEQIKRLGYISWWHLANDKHIFYHEEIQTLQPIVNIELFIEIGLIISGKQASANNSTTIVYQFAHRTLQEYFAAMFMVRWEDQWRKTNVVYRKVENRLAKKENRFVEESKFFSEILLTKRKEYQLNDAVKQYLTNSKKICFNIQSNDTDESLEQLEYSNTILQECQNIETVHINLNDMILSKSIDLSFRNIQQAQSKHRKKFKNIELIISDGKFHDSIISVSGDKTINTINFAECQFTLSRLIEFAKFVDKNAAQFKCIGFQIKNDPITDIDTVIANTQNDCFEKFKRKLEIRATQLCAKSIFSIVQLFCSINALDLQIPQPKLGDELMLLESIANLSNLSNLSNLKVSMHRNDGDTGANFNFIREIVKRCMKIRSVHICCKDAQSNIISVYDNNYKEFKNIDIDFGDCQFSYAQLMQFVNFIDRKSANN